MCAMVSAENPEVKPDQKPKTGKKSRYNPKFKHYSAFKTTINTIFMGHNKLKASSGTLCVINRRKIDMTRCPQYNNAQRHRKLTNKLYRSYNRTMRRLQVKANSPVPKFRSK